MGNANSMSKCAICGSVDFERCITATGLPVVDPQIINAASQIPFDYNDYSRLVCTKCRAPSSLADIPPPRYGCNYHPDMLEKVKINIFSDTLPLHFASATTAPKEIIDFLLPYFTAGYSKPLYDEREARHRERLDLIKLQLQNHFDMGKSDRKLINQLVQQYLQLEHIHNISTRGVLIKHGQEFLIPYETLTSLTGSLIPKSEQKLVRVIISQCYPSVGYVTGLTEVSLGHKYEPRRQIDALHILPTFYSLQQMTAPLTKIPEIYFSYQDLLSKKQNIEATSLKTATIELSLPSSGWSLSGVEKKVKLLNSTIDITQHDIRSNNYELMACSSPGGISLGDQLGETVDYLIWFKNSVKLHNTLVHFITQIAPNNKNVMSALRDHNMELLKQQNNKTKLNMVSNDELWKKMLYQPLRSLQLLSTSTETQSSTKKDVIKAEQDDEKKGVASYSNTIGKHMYMGKTFLIDPHYEKMSIALKEECEKKQKETEKKVVDKIKSMNSSKSEAPEVTMFNAHAESSYLLLSSLEFLQILENGSIILNNTNPSPTKETSKTNPTSSFSTTISAKQLALNALFSHDYTLNQRLSLSTNIDKNDKKSTNKTLINSPTESLVAMYFSDDSCLAIPHHFVIAKYLENPHENSINSLALSRILESLSIHTKNMYYLNWFRTSKKAPPINSNASLEAVQFQIIRSIPEDGYLTDQTHIFIAGASQHSEEYSIAALENAQKSTTKPFTIPKNPKYFTLKDLASITFYPITQSIPLKHRYNNAIDRSKDPDNHPTHIDAFKSAWMDFMRTTSVTIPLGADTGELVTIESAIKTKKIPPDQCLALFREKHGVENKYVSQQLVLAKYILPGLAGTFRRFKVGEIVNISGAWFKVGQCIPFDHGIVTAQTQISLEMPWIDANTLPSSQLMSYGAIASLEGVRPRPQAQAGADTPYSFDDNNDQYNGNCSKKAITDLISAVPMSNDLRDRFNIILNQFPNDHPGLYTLYYELHQQWVHQFEQRPGIYRINWSSINAAVEQYRSQQHKYINESLLFIMKLFLYNDKNPRDETQQLFAVKNSKNDIDYVLINQHLVDSTGFQHNNKDSKENGMSTASSASFKQYVALTNDNMPNSTTSNHISQDEYSDDQTHYKMCSICLDEYRQHDVVRILPCSHRFHAACSGRWFENAHLRCPYCQTNILSLLSQRYKMYQQFPSNVINDIDLVLQNASTASHLE